MEFMNSDQASAGQGVGCSTGFDLGDDIHVMLPSVYVEFSKSVHTRFDDSIGESCSDDIKFVLGEADPPEVGVPYRLIFIGRLRNIIMQYHIPPNFVCRVPNSAEFISISGPLEGVFYKEAFRAGLKIPLLYFIVWLL